MNIVKAAALAVLGVAVVAGAQAADFPKKDVKIIVPFKPGGGVDTTNRIMAEIANKKKMLGKYKLVIENRPSSVVGQAFAARAKPDGYTVLAMTSSVVTNPKIKNTPYTLASFEPVGYYMLTPELICVAKDSPIKTIDDFIKKAKSGSVSMTLSEVGTSHHMAGLALEAYGGLKIKFIHFKAFGEQIQQVLGGHVDGALWPSGEAARQIEADVVRPLAISSNGRFKQFPDLPTWEEVGLDIKEFATVRGWGVPKGTPDEAVDYLADLLGKITSDPETVEKMSAAGYKPLVYKGRKGFDETLKNYDAMTTRIIESAGLAKKKK
jgi:tripartite-type tricarboxylate transporter receptor subunit TctC